MLNEKAQPNRKLKELSSALGQLLGDMRAVLHWNARSGLAAIPQASVSGKTSLFGWEDTPLLPLSLVKPSLLKP